MCVREKEKENRLRYSSVSLVIINMLQLADTSRYIYNNKLKRRTFRRWEKNCVRMNNKKKEEEEKERKEKIYV